MFSVPSTTYVFFLDNKTPWDHWEEKESTIYLCSRGWKLKNKKKALTFTKIKTGFV